MDISWFEAFLYGMIAGLTEILPVSSQAHQSILSNLFGIIQPHGLLGLSALTGSFFAVFISCASAIKRMLRESALAKNKRNRKKKAVNLQYVFDWNFLKTACIPLLIGYFLLRKLSDWRYMLPVVSALMAVNGLLLHIPAYLSKGNKDSRSMSGLDGLLFGLFSAFGFLPGISRIGAGISLASARGADAQQAFRWSLLLSVPGLALAFLAEAAGVFSADTVPLENGFLLKCVLIGVVSFVGSSLGIRAMKAASVRLGFECFSYYCWGAALFSFILYLF